MATVQDLTDAGIDWAYLYKPFPTVEGDLQSGWTAEISFLVPYGEQTTKFLLMAGGTPVTVGNATRVVPLIHPDYSALLCTHLRAEGFGTPSFTEEGPLWSHSRIRATFTGVPFPTDNSEPFMTRNVRKTGEYITIPGSAFVFPSDGTPIQQDSGVFVPTTALTITLYFCPTLKDDVSDGLIGCVNLLPFLGRPTGTVRYDGMESELSTLANGQITYTKTQSYVFRPVPHNQVLRPNGVWEAPVSTATGGFIHAAANLNVLLV